MSTVNAQICDFKTKVKSFSLFHKEFMIYDKFFYFLKNGYREHMS